MDLTFYFYFYFLFIFILNLELESSMMLQTVTCHMILSQVMITQLHVTERCTRFQNNDIIPYVNSILLEP